MTVDAGIDITKAGDRGVLKKIITEGQGTERPNPGCNVEVHYTGTLLDGTKFDSSRDRNEPFTFKLGKGSVIKAWDIGVATMKKGEVCMLTCAPEYAYGAGGSPPKIPPNATLQFEIEMLDWEQEDLSPSKNKGILRTIIEQGEGSEMPNEGAEVTVELEGRLHPDGKVVDPLRTVTFPLGEGAVHDIVDGVEKALEKFNKGEKSKITIAPKYGFKSAGNTKLGVPGNATLEYTVKLVNFENVKDTWLLEGPEKIEMSKTAKEKGTKYFKDNKLALAIKMYKRVITYTEDLETPGETETEEVKKEGKELLLSAYLNLSLVYLKLSPAHYVEARDFATKALNIDEKNVKALFRRGQALLGMGDADAAERDFQKCVELEPSNKAAANQIILCKQAVQKQKQKEKKMYANMFEKFAKHDTELENLKAKEQDVIGEKVGQWGAADGEWTDEQRDRKPTEFEKENPNILMLDKDGKFSNM